MLYNGIMLHQTTYEKQTKKISVTTVRSSTYFELVDFFTPNALPEAVPQTVTKIR